MNAFAVFRLSQLPHPIERLTSSVLRCYTDAVGIGVDYEIGPGDELTMYVTGRDNLDYHVGNAVNDSSALDRTTVTPAGDVVFIPEKIFSDWRDVIQLLTSYRLIQTVRSSKGIL